jgi:uncharacterized protein (TIGR02594 family)
MSDEGIAGVLANIKEESGFDPTLRHPDQPKFGGEAHFAHGLYQEGGDEWNHYEAWLAKNHPGADWRDPVLQSRFAAENLKTNYPKVWQKMLSGNREAAAEAYVGGYLKPAQQYQQSRIAKFQARGVPALSSYPTSGTPTTSEARPSGPTGDPTVPHDILAAAQHVALQGGPTAVSQFMRDQGYPKAGNWCGEFAASVVRSAGYTPPQNPEVASNWRTFGSPVEGAPQPGDIAVRRGARTGALGSHVTFVESYDPKTGTFIGLGGNQRAGPESRFQAGGYEFRHPEAPVRTAAAPAQGMELTGVRRRFDDLLSPQRVDGSGEIHVKVDQASFHRPRSVLQKVAMPVFAQGEKASVGPPAPVAATGEGRDTVMEE